MELDVATVATFNTQNVATLSNFNPLKFTIYMHFLPLMLGSSNIGLEIYQVNTTN